MDDANSITFLNAETLTDDTMMLRYLVPFSDIWPAISHSVLSAFPRKKKDNWDKFLEQSLLKEPSIPYFEALYPVTSEKHPAEPHYQHQTRLKSHHIMCLRTLGTEQKNTSAIL